MKALEARLVAHLLQGLVEGEAADDVVEAASRGTVQRLREEALGVGCWYGRVSKLQCCERGIFLLRARAEMTGGVEEGWGYLLVQLSLSQKDCQF